MYKVMIVDDEMLARIGIKSMVEWEQHDFEIVGEAENGQKALNLAKQLRPDIIITDIKMPVMNGVELIKQAELLQLGAKFIVLSAYDDFPYVKEAMKAGAEDYLIKLELQPDQLLQILHGVKDKLEQEKKKKHHAKQGTFGTNRNLTILRNNFVREILAGRIYSQQEVEASIPQLDSELFKASYICYVVQPDQFSIYEKYTKDDVHLLDFAMQNVIEEVVGARAKGLVLATAEREITIFLFLENDQSSFIQSELEQMEDAVKAALKTYLNVSVVCGASDIHRYYEKLRQSYKEASLAVDRRFSYAPGSTIRYGEAARYTPQPIELSLELKELEQALAIADEQAMKRILQMINAKICETKHLSKEQVKGFCTTLLYIAEATLISHHIELKAEWKESMNHKASRLGNTADFSNWLEQVEQELIDKLLDTKETTKLIRSIKKYIAIHFAEDVHLESISSEMNLSVNYISHVFKRETGQTIVEYITEWRIEQAIHLLQTTDKKIYEVGQLVGYENEHYFSRVFKKVTGVSPNRYKR